MDWAKPDQTEVSLGLRFKPCLAYRASSHDPIPVSWENPTWMVYWDPPSIEFHFFRWRNQKKVDQPLLV